MKSRMTADGTMAARSARTESSALPFQGPRAALEQVEQHARPNAIAVRVACKEETTRVAETTL
jgi:hypothetical protein